MTTVVTPRMRHYGAFYGIAPLDAANARPAIVHGNCQAESLRVMLAAGGVPTVRIPPVHELTAEDLPHLERVCAAAGMLVTQPIRRGYRGLPVGSGEIAALCRTGVRCVRVPVIRYAGLYPAQAIIRPPGDPGAVPPLVAYHDLRVLAQAAGLGRAARLTVRAVRRIARASVAELARREAAAGTVVVSDLFGLPRFDAMRTINHPGNPIWEALAARVVKALGRELEPCCPRQLLDAVHAPREREVIDAFGLDAEPVEHWRIDGRAVDPEAARQAHLAWYARRPEVVRAGLERHRATLTELCAS